jgi:hypothetical protein
LDLIASNGLFSAVINCATMPATSIDAVPLEEEEVEVTAMMQA